MEFTAAECLRPEIIRRSLASFVTHLLDVEWDRSTLYVNVDPAGDMSCCADDAVKFCRSVFGCVVMNAPSDANFAKAMKWAWSCPVDPVFFHLQLDWLLTKDVSIEAMKCLLYDDTDEAYSAVNLCAYMGVAKSNRLCLSPGLVQTSVALDLSNRWNTVDGPEAQLRSPSFRDGGRSLGDGILSKHYPQEPVLRDIGRQWMDERGLQKKETGPRHGNFVDWK